MTTELLETYGCETTVLLQRLDKKELEYALIKSDFLQMYTRAKPVMIHLIYVIARNFDLTGICLTVYKVEEKQHKNSVKVTFWKCG